jgi:hypothetical protein
MCLALRLGKTCRPDTEKEEGVCQDADNTDQHLSLPFLALSWSSPGIAALVLYSRRYRHLYSSMTLDPPGL